MRIKISFREGFNKTLKPLNDKQRDKLAGLVVLLSANPFNSKLRTKALSGKLSGLYSFRISRDYRVLFQFISPVEICLLELGHRKDIYR